MNTNFTINKDKLDKISADVLKPVGINRSFHIWMAFLTILLIPCLISYAKQLHLGLRVTGLNDYVSWGLYLANFVFFVAASLVGMLISAVLGLIGIEWIKPITRIAEIIAVAFAAMAGLVIVMDMGHPERLLHVFLYGRIQSPIVWDVTVVTTYLTLSALLYLLPLIPDLAIAKGKMKDPPKWMFMLYNILSFKWTGNHKQYQILFKSVRILLVLIVPTAFAIHTVTSWLFAATPRAGWDSTIFGPYFVTGAFVAGSAALIIAMHFFRYNYKLHNYLTDMHFDKMGKLLVLVSLVYLYFNINEYLVPAYKMKAADAHHIQELFTGHYSVMFWMVQLLGLVIPILLLLLPQARKPFPLLIISVFVLVAAWFKRFLIVVPTMEHPFLPKQNVPDKWMQYTPTIDEVMITLAPIVMAVMIISVLAKLFPVIPMWELAEEHGDGNKIKPE